ncbi:signal transduction histidine kinase [Microbacterium terrae]|uniref:histidine kinase n=1 Tax=Microbacterium terrae TaxID=69369 RepID=A0A0M2HEF8_9MICO|nr:sensor histidine kinase [Microbacterium terrae]KJL45020.1 Signal transduction histidine-protein kinase/phosphatase DegS [Microbacterium terrae]MBP1077217.1 signal transduction histidine kinase [Microbacterium terrae]GLJ99810.1 histidine kinase [Microbacterium terrae]
MTATTTDLPSAAAPPAAGRGFWASYGLAWARTPGSALYLLVAFVLAMVSVSLLWSLFWTGVGLLVLVIGLPLVVLTLFIARGFGLADRQLLRLTGLPPIGEPEWNRDKTAGGFWMTLTRSLRNPHYWVYLVHGAVVAPIVSTITFVVTTVWLSVSLGGLTYWFWSIFLPRGDRGEGEWGHYVSDAVPRLFGGWQSEQVEIVLYLVAGVLFTVTLPWVLGGLARAHHAIAEGMLGRWNSDDLAAEVRAEATARDAAVHAEDAALRRLERDIHDGPQQRLVRLQMDLAALERRAESGDADAAASLARDARAHAKAALDELRALSSGVAPPLLQDRGLAAALAAVSASTPLDVRTEIDPALDALVEPEIARTVYFTVAELLTNAVKHSGATGATVKAALRPQPADTLPMLDVWVVDNGRGGAAFVTGHGLEGLRQRMAGLRATLSLDSPVGGPTAVGAHIPIRPRVS